MALYIRDFTLVTKKDENTFLEELQRTCYNGVYPYKLFPELELERIEFEPITVFHGDNGSGKTTLLNIIAHKAHVMRHSAFNSSPFFNQYVAFCKMTAEEVPKHSQILTSDDVFDYVLNIRYLNDGIDVRREELFEDYLDRKYASHRLRSLDDYDDWKESYEAKTHSQSHFVRNRLMRNVNMFSNGESAMRYFIERITENAIYFLDEPENSLSAEHQLELKKYIEDSVRHFGCQFIIATHSPIMLSLQGAKIYDLDVAPVTTCKWTDLEDVRLYFDFFNAHRQEFEQE